MAIVVCWFFNAGAQLCFKTKLPAVKSFVFLYYLSAEDFLKKNTECKNLTAIELSDYLKYQSPICNENETSVEMY